jgi:hypothetical protein
LKPKEEIAMQFNNMGLFNKSSDRTFTNEEVDFGYFSKEGKVKATGEKVIWDATQKVWKLKPTKVKPLSVLQGMETDKNNKAFFTENN